MVTNLMEKAPGFMEYVTRSHVCALREFSVISRLHCICTYSEHKVFPSLLHVVFSFILA